jgi:hypothetical protein
LPSRTSLTASGRRCLAVGCIDDRNVGEIDTVLFRQRFDGARPHQDRCNQAQLRSSTAPRNELSSHGWATAVGVGGNVLQKSSSR